MLDTTSFQSAVTKLQEMWDYTKQDKVECDTKLKEFLRTGLIQAYEYSYEMATKTMKRAIEDLDLQKENAPELSFREMLRHAREHQLVAEIEPWMIYRDMRNKTSHAYAEDKAIEVISIIPAFLNDARFLLASIEKRSKDSA